MEIRYSQFTECSISFTPSREEQEVMLVCLKAARSKYEKPENTTVFDYFIGQIEHDLASSTQ